ncbi:MAG: glycosyltransferase [Planctomycetales bacterium]|nr:glycosyltransferase [Planctomycetales bacterium]
MRILTVHNHYRIRGGEDVCFEADTKMLRDRGHEVIHYTRHNDDVGRTSRWREARETLWSRHTYDEVTRLIKTQRPDVMHVHNTFPLISPSVYDAAHDQGLAVVQSLHNFRPLCVGAALCRDGQYCDTCLVKGSPWAGVRHRCYRDSLAASAVSALLNRRNQRRNLWRRIDRFITFCGAARDLYIQGGFPADRIELNPHYVEQEIEPREHTDRAFVFVGRLNREKGLDRLLQAWDQYRGDWKLRIIGEGPLAEAAQAQAARDARIQFIGKVPRQECLGWMASSSCLLFPSPAFETFGRVVIEAFSLGIPVIASRLGGPRDIINSPLLGTLIEPTDVSAMSAALSEAESWWDGFAERRAACRSRYLDAYTIETNYEKLLRIYESAIERRAGRRTREVFA